jgi:multiple antibiotic resistance protein
VEYLQLFAATFVSIFVIVDPFGILPVYLTITQRFGIDDRLTICRRASIIAAAFLVAIAFTGDFLFRIFGITIPAFQIAGGLLLLVLAMEQLNAGRSRVRGDEEQESRDRDDVSIFPIATPLLAGPGAISTIVLLASKNGTFSERLILASAILSVFGLSYVILRHGQILFKLLGKTGLNLLTRVMGIILAAVAIQFVIDGIRMVVASFRV